MARTKQTSRITGSCAHSLLEGGILNERYARRLDALRRAPVLAPHQPCYGWTSLPDNILSQILALADGKSFSYGAELEGTGMRPVDVPRIIPRVLVGSVPVRVPPAIASARLCCKQWRRDLPLRLSRDLDDKIEVRRVVRAVRVRRSGEGEGEGEGEGDGEGTDTGEGTVTDTDTGDYARAGVFAKTNLEPGRFLARYEVSTLHLGKTLKRYHCGRIPREVLANPAAFQIPAKPVDARLRVDVVAVPGDSDLGSRFLCVCQAHSNCVLEVFPNPGMAFPASEPNSEVVVHGPPRDMTVSHRLAAIQKAREQDIWLKASTRVFPGQELRVNSYLRRNECPVCVSGQ